MADMDVCDGKKDAADLGVRLKLVRKIYGISQRQLARQAGVTNATISFIEQGRVSPSVGSLEKILSSVPMTLSEFFSLELVESDPIFFRSSDMPNVGDGRFFCQLLGGSRSQRAMSILRTVFSEGQDSGPNPLIFDGEVGGIVIAGELEVSAGSDLALLEAGDGYYFGTRRPHRFRNPGKTDCVVISTVNPAHAIEASWGSVSQIGGVIKGDLRHQAEKAD
ncbi:helix-turn-helix domain-containing protein [uncultured Microbulbifer sp.]|uniref:helix-turn-helix domain-containing protein n=1 Tax=uncultured Microbulbifer sp. TaxID=348147 RepID=UPI0026240206|nr:helix-turn-helix domain-containing protein [uncultured Microbulbifer sp.]